MSMNLSAYSRKSLSDFLQIAQQCYDAGHPLPCWLVEHLAEAHDALLDASKAKDRPASNRLLKCKMCGNSVDELPYKLECGLQICSRCWSE